MCSAKGFDDESFADLAGAIDKKGITILGVVESC